MNRRQCTACGKWLPGTIVYRRERLILVVVEEPDRLPLEVVHLEVRREEHRGDYHSEPLLASLMVPL